MKIAVCAKQIPDPANPIEYSNGNVVRPDEQVLDDTVICIWGLTTSSASL